MKNPNNATSARGRASGVCVAIAFVLSCASCRDSAADAKAATDAILQQIAKYTAALDAADTDLAAQVWRTSTEVSLINPALHLHGWEEIKGFYNYFGSNFTARKLTARDVSVHVNGESAWVEFYWHFTAKQNQDGAAIETDGRSTQIYEKAGNRWQLVHEHYSSPVTAP